MKYIKRFENFDLETLSDKEYDNYTDLESVEDLSDEDGEEMRRNSFGDG